MNLPTTSSPEEQPPPFRSWTNRRVSLAVVSVMVFMGLVGLSWALVTVQWRRQNDFRGKRQATAPLILQEPGELAGLGYLPPDVNVIAVLDVAELLKDPAAGTLLAAPRPALFDMLLSLVERVTSLKAADLDAVIVGTEIKDKLPQLTLVVQTTKPYVPAQLAEALRPAVATVQRRLSPLPFPTSSRGNDALVPRSPHAGYALSLRFAENRGPRGDTVASTQGCRGGSRRPCADLLSQQRINKQSLGWAAGQLERPALLNNLLPLAPGLAGKAQLLTNVRAFTLSLYSQEGMVLDGAFSTGDEKGTGLVRKQIEEMNPHTFKSYKVAVPPPGADAAAQWVTLQIRGEVQTFRELLGPK